MVPDEGLARRYGPYVRTGGIVMGIESAIYEYPVIAAALLVALGTITRYAVKYFRAIRKAVHSVMDLFNRIEGSVTYTEAQVRLNGGSSLRDQTNRVEKKLDELSDQFTEHVADCAVEQADLKRRLDHIDTNTEA